MTNKELIEKARKLLEGTTPGPWQPHEDEPRVIVERRDPYISMLAIDTDGTAIIWKKEDAALMAASRELIPALVEALEVALAQEKR